MKLSTVAGRLALGAGAAVVTTVLPAQAFSTQQVGPYSFSTTGTGLTTPGGGITIDPFTADSASTLTAVKLIFQPTYPAFSGTATLVNISASPISFTATGQVLFNFSNSTQLTGAAAALSLNPNSGSGITTPSIVTGTYNPSTTTTATTNTTALQNYFAGAPSITSYLTTYNFTASDPANGFMGFSATTLSGNFYIQYQYTATVPAPLPIAGAAMAFAHSRRLRKRIKARQALA